MATSWQDNDGDWLHMEAYDFKDGYTLHLEVVQQIFVVNMGSGSTITSGLWLVFETVTW